MTNRKILTLYGDVEDFFDVYHEFMVTISKFGSTDVAVYDGVIDDYSKRWNVPDVNITQVVPLGDGDSFAYSILNSKVYY